MVYIRELLWGTHVKLLTNLPMACWKKKRRKGKGISLLSVAITKYLKLGT
jgi:hypothetical protein